ncbi:hypothetical protein ACIO8H_24895 [Streptomyces sp. NPDC087226]|uniref:hypothetical protein n=1 Tax=Streptomyces sp. NPDC087226 TaxID=3365771 RepID=UPI003828F395
MVSGTRAVHNIEVTAESLQEDLDRLEAQKQALERELAAVVAHLGSVQRALGALQVLMRDPSAGPADTAPAAEPRQTPAPRADAPPEVTARTPAQVRRTSTAADADADADAEGQKKYGRLTEQILDYFATVGDTDVRARDVAAALGRDTDSGTINAVRSTLDRLVGTSRIRRSGRGLYRAKRS